MGGKTTIEMNKDAQGDPRHVIGAPKSILNFLLIHVIG